MKTLFPNVGYIRVSMVSSPTKPPYGVPKTKKSRCSPKLLIHFCLHFKKSPINTAKKRQKNLKGEDIPLKSFTNNSSYLSELFWTKKKSPQRRQTQKGNSLYRGQYIMNSSNSKENPVLQTQSAKKGGQ